RHRRGSGRPPARQRPQPGDLARRAEPPARREPLGRPGRPRPPRLRAGHRDAAAARLRVRPHGDDQAPLAGEAPVDRVHLLDRPRADLDQGRQRPRCVGCGRRRAPHRRRQTEPDPTTRRTAMALFGQEHFARYRETDGAEGHEWRPGVYTLILTTTGRRSGQPRPTPLIYGTHDGDHLVVASKGGSDEPPAWYRNLTANPEVEVQVGGDRFR